MIVDDNELSTVSLCILNLIFKGNLASFDKNNLALKAILCIILKVFSLSKSSGYYIHIIIIKVVLFSIVIDVHKT